MMSFSRYLRTISFIAFILITLNCNLFKDKDWIIMPARPYEVIIPDTVQLGQNISFELICEVGNPCYLFSHLDINSEDYDVFVKIYAKLDPHAICIRDADSIKAIGSYKPPSEGNYNFHFWQSETSSLDTTVVVIK